MTTGTRTQTPHKAQPAPGLKLLLVCYSWMEASSPPLQSWPRTLNSYNRTSQTALLRIIWPQTRFPVCRTRPGMHTPENCQDWCMLFPKGTGPAKQLETSTSKPSHACPPKGTLLDPQPMAAVSAASNPRHLSPEQAKAPTRSLSPSQPRSFPQPSPTLPHASAHQTSTKDRSYKACRQPVTPAWAASWHSADCPPRCCLTRCTRSLLPPVDSSASSPPPGLTFGPWSACLGAAAAQGGRDDLGRQVKVVAQVLDALIGQVPVEMPPCKLLLHVATGLQRLETEFSYLVKDPYHCHTSPTTALTRWL